MLRLPTPPWPTPGLDRHRIDDTVRELRLLVDYSADLVKRRSMLINQHKAQLHMWLGHTPRQTSPGPGTWRR